MHSAWSILHHAICSCDSLSVYQLLMISEICVKWASLFDVSISFTNSQIQFWHSYGLGPRNDMFMNEYLLAANLHTAAKSR
jgi:hypothetical protein